MTVADRSPEPVTTSGPSTAASPASSPDGAPTPLPDLLPSALSLKRFTVVCESWAAERPAPSIDCGEAVALALGAIGPERAASIRRLDFRFGDDCTGATSCAGRRPDVGWIVARSAEFETIGIRVAIDETGELRAWPPLPGPVEPPPAFTPPRRQRADLGSGLPGELRDREPVPFCGSEDLTTPDAFSTAARRCFLGGVLAGVAVELVSRSVSTEGGDLLTLYRFAGGGAVLRYLREADAWSGTACGISPIPTSGVFILAGTCERLSP